MDGAKAYRVFNKNLGNTPGGQKSITLLSTTGCLHPKLTLQAAAVLLILEIKY